MFPTVWKTLIYAHLVRVGGVSRYRKDGRSYLLTPSTPRSDQFQISPAASPEILYYTVWRTWQFHSLLWWNMVLLPILTSSLINFSSNVERMYFVNFGVNPFTPESDQCQNSPAASQEIWHHTVWRTWLFIAYSDEKWLYYKFSLHHSHNRFLKGWENTLFELRSERVEGLVRQLDISSCDKSSRSIWCTVSFIDHSAQVISVLGTAMRKNKPSWNRQLRQGNSIRRKDQSSLGLF